MSILSILLTGFTRFYRIGMSRIASSGWSGGRGRGRGEFFGQEAAVFVSAVAKWLVRRMTAAAERDHRLVGRQRKRIALLIDDLEHRIERPYAFDHQRAIGSQTNLDLGHRGIPALCMRYWMGSARRQT